MSDANLYPDDAPGTRRRGRRRKRPAHLPPRAAAPVVDAGATDTIDRARRSVTTTSAPPPASFGARPGRSGALRFHELHRVVAQRDAAEAGAQEPAGEADDVE